MEKEQWDLLWTGEQAFWKAVPHLLAAGHHTAEELTEPRRPSTGRPYKIPRLMAAQEGERTQLMRILLSGGIGGIDERTRERWSAKSKGGRDSEQGSGTCQVRHVCVKSACGPKLND